jgi:hypothetical protein
MTVLYAICWNNPDTNKTVITEIINNKNKAEKKLEYHNHRYNIHYIVECSNCDIR